jgi:hypothetical protein
MMQQKGLNLFRKKQSAMLYACYIHMPHEMVNGTLSIIQSSERKIS